MANDDMELDQLRLLKMKGPCRLALPVNTHIRFYVKTDDFMYGWSVPALGLKFDPSLGKFNKPYFVLTEKGTYHGEYRAICGDEFVVKPFIVDVYSSGGFANWLVFNSKFGKNIIKACNIINFVEPPQLLKMSMLCTGINCLPFFNLFWTIL
jgi:hypothetical protein